MTVGGAEQRLAAIYAEIGRLGLPALVMGGHAVRFYGVDRSTIDFDLVVAIDASGLDDLIRSKETEREDDWRDVRLLEEIADERRLAVALSASGQVPALAAIRSQRGFETARRMSILGANDSTRQAATAAAHPVTRAFLAPLAPAVPIPETAGDEAIRSLLTGVLTAVEPGSARHLALVEAVRRLHQRRCMAADRADKERAGPAKPSRQS